METLHWTSLSATYFQQHFLILFFCVIFWCFLQCFKLFNYFIYYGNLWSVVFDISIVIVLRCHELYPYKMVKSVNKCRVYTNHPTPSFPISLPLLRDHSPSFLISLPPHSLRHNNVELGSLIILQWPLGLQAKGPVISYCKPKARND